MAIHVLIFGIVAAAAAASTTLMNHLLEIKAGLHMITPISVKAVKQPAANYSRSIIRQEQASLNRFFLAF